MNKNVSPRGKQYKYNLDTDILQNENESLRLINENLTKQNQDLSVQLSAARQRNSEVWKKIQSLDGSVGNLMQLKESFFSIKQHLDEKLKLREDKSVQTWKNFICQSCVKFAQICDYFEEPASYKEQYDVTNYRRQKLCDIQEAIAELKNFLTEREDGIEEFLDAYDANEQLVTDLKSDIKNLKSICTACKKHNVQLTDELQMKNKEIKMFNDKIHSLSKLLSDRKKETRDLTLTRGGDETKDNILDKIIAIIKPQV